MKTRIKNLLLLLLLLGLPGVVEAQVNYAVSGNTAYVTNSPNASGNVVITNTYDGYPVTSIGNEAFYEDYSLTSVTLPDTITSIGEAAFYRSSLTSVTIPNSVTSIGDYAFASCSGLMNVIIPISVTSIGIAPFDDEEILTAITVATNNPAYSSLNGVLFDKSQAKLIEYPGGLSGSYTISNSVTSIGDDAFEDCIYLTSVTIPNSVTSIGDSAFEGCFSLTSVTIGNSVIGENEFEQCYSLTSVTIGNGVTSIGDGAFGDCNSLTSVTIPNSVTSFGDYAFSGSGLTNVTIPGSVTSIGVGVFQYCNSLTSVTIGNSVIGENEFDQCYSLTNVTIGNSVTSIGGGGVGAFAYCTNLTSVYFAGNAPSPTNDSYVFYADPAIVYYLPGTTGWGAMFDGRPTAPWFLPNPQILNRSAGFGVQPGGFGFTISWATNASVVVQAATNLANPVWLPVSTNTLTGGTNYFSDPQWTNYPERFYRAVGAYTVGGTLTGLPAGDTVTLQDNGSDNLTLSTNGTFTFLTALPNDHAYSVTVSGTSGRTPPNITLRNGSGTISGANVTNVAVQCTKCPEFTGNMDVDMYNAAVSDGTANGGVPAVMVTENGGPFRVTARGFCSDNVCLAYSGQCVVATIVGTTSCSSTTLPSGTVVIQFGGALECGFGPYGY